MTTISVLKLDDGTITIVEKKAGVGLVVAGRVSLFDALAQLVALFGQLHDNNVSECDSCFEV